MSPIETKWKEFASNTTLHGLRYVADKSHSISRRGIWLIFLGAAATTYVYLASLSLIKFFSRPIKTEISQETPTEGLKFPAVTICNLNRFMRSKIDTADEDENFVKMGLNISGCNETRKVRGNLTCGQAFLCIYTPWGAALVKGCNRTVQQNIKSFLSRSSDRLFNKEEFLTKYGHDIASLTASFVYCRFMKTKICSKGDFVPKLTQYGICFTFNSGNDGVLRRAIHEGPDFGLSVFLDVQTHETTFSQFSSGLKVIVHDQNTFVNRYNGFNIVPGTHASVAIKLKKHIRLPAPFKTNCRQDKLPGIGSYNKDGCLHQCTANFTFRQCGCRGLGLPGPEGTPVCSMQDKECVDNSQSQVNLTECACSNACSELAYASSVSYSRFPDDSLIDIFQKFLPISPNPDYMRANYVFLQLGFQHLAYEKREDVPSYGLESLLGEFGGNMGLFLGCSILTLCEFIDFLSEAVISRMRKNSLEVDASPGSDSYAKHQEKEKTNSEYKHNK
ncbi:acid-sensing ion channel 1-like [Montipora capricornis]|uniref:acid-sensing ion channel 1-like n=1 Tax=Montipora capricornis TaxID=246305 RepID=UPI0035F1E91F